MLTRGCCCLLVSIASSVFAQCCCCIPISPLLTLRLGSKSRQRRDDASSRVSCLHVPHDSRQAKTNIIARRLSDALLQQTVSFRVAHFRPPRTARDHFAQSLRCMWNRRLRVHHGKATGIRPYAGTLRCILPNSAQAHPQPLF
jgi:hypothetical protein